jgi:ABC-type multidrug transport system fused ATPase/permease subunit
MRGPNGKWLSIMNQRNQQPRRWPRLAWRFQFSLATFLGVVLLASLLLGLVGGVLREAANFGSVAFLVFLLLLTAAPLALTMLSAWIFQLRRGWNENRRRPPVERRRK